MPAPRIPSITYRFGKPNSSMSSFAPPGTFPPPSLRTSPRATLVTRGRDHVVVSATERFVELFGKRRAIGERLRHAFPILAESPCLAAMDESYRDGSTVRLDRVSIGHDGAAASYSLTVTPVIEGAQGDATVVGVMVTARAHDHAKRADEQSRGGEVAMRERVLEATVAMMREGVTVVDGEGVIVFANQAAEEMYGASRGGLTGHTVTELTSRPHWEIAHILAAIDTQIGESGVWSGDRHNRRLDDGTAFVTAARMTTLRLDDAHFRLCVEENVTEQRRDDERTAFLANGASILAQSLDYRETLAALARLCVPTIADMALIDVISEHGVAQRIGCAHRDPSCEELLCATPTLPGRTAGKGAGTRAADEAPLFLRDVGEGSATLLTPEGDDAVRFRELRVSSWLSVPIALHGASFGTIALAMNGSGRRFNEADLEVVLDLAARAANAVDNARLHDATTAARDEAERANRAKSELLSHASHDLRTPLNAISGYAELLEMGILGEVNDAQRDALARIQRSQRHLLALINDLLNFTRLEAGSVDFELAEVELSGVAAEVTSLLHDQAESRGVALHCESAGEVRTWADEEKVFQIVLHLLRNAVKFTAAGGSVAVRVSQQDDSALLSVADTGIGIPADKMQAIFEPFTQVGRSFSRPQEGSGLGLAISRELARAMGGELRASSVLEEGSTFTLVLPRERKGTPAQS